MVMGGSDACESAKRYPVISSGLHRVLVMAASGQHSSCVICLTAETYQTVLSSHAVTWHVLDCSGFISLHFIALHVISLHFISRFQYGLSIEVSRAPHAIMMGSVLIALQ